MSAALALFGGADDRPGKLIPAVVFVCFVYSVVPSFASIRLRDMSAPKPTRQQPPGPTPPLARGRGAASNPPNRFESIVLERDADWDPAEDPAPRTRFYRDTSCSILSYNDSPDVGFDVSVNPYRGCEHGCAYCYARPTHEYLGFSAGLDFETRIMVKEDAPALLRRELASPRWTPQVIAFSGVTDCYQPVERRLKLTRRCLEVLLEFRNPVSIVTKNSLVTRDLDVLSELARHQAVLVMLSLTTLDAALAPKLEPRAALPARRLAAVEALRQAGVPVGVLVAPVIPALNDHEIPALLRAARAAGASFASYIVLRLPLSVGPIFEAWLARHVPARRDKVLQRLRALRSGRLNDARFGFRMRGEGVWAEQISALFAAACRLAGLTREAPSLSVAAFRVPASASEHRQCTFPF
jgi:DNA repair photolyase